MKLPIGIQTFEKIIQGGYVYADKTKDIYNLVNDGSYFFLSRPCGFGKSLLIDTMHELFSGHRELFEGLWIAGCESDYDFTPYPVIRLDMTRMENADPVSLENDLIEFVNATAASHGIENLSGSLELRFAGLIEALSGKCGRGVVVLIDEYDSPVIDRMDNVPLAKANRTVLDDFYGVLKGQDANLHFVLVTGVSKLTNLAMSSRLNNLTDVSMETRYATICGIADSEFDQLFASGLDGETRAKVSGWYGGYSWDGSSRVFNPHSLLSYMRTGTFKEHWNATGVPAFLAEIIKGRPSECIDIQDNQDNWDIRNVTITEDDLVSSYIEDASLAALLFQTGFLSVTSANLKATPPKYTLGIPNVEVSSAMDRLFLPSAARN